jgi:hypothetical protein
VAAAGSSRSSAIASGSLNCSTGSEPRYAHVVTRCPSRPHANPIGLQGGHFATTYPMPSARSTSPGQRRSPSETYVGRLLDVQQPRATAAPRTSPRLTRSSREGASLLALPLFGRLPTHLRHPRPLILLFPLLRRLGSTRKIPVSSAWSPRLRRRVTTITAYDLDHLLMVPGPR